MLLRLWLFLCLIILLSSYQLFFLTDRVQYPAAREYGVILQIQLHDYSRHLVSHQVLETLTLIVFLGL